MGNLVLGTVNADVLYGTEDSDTILSLGGDDTVFGYGGNDAIFGGAGNDIIDGGYGYDFLDGGSGVDRLTGGWGQDVFFFSNDPFAGGAPNPPDVITDYQFWEDKLFFSKDALGIDALSFQAGISSELYGDSNLIVLLDPFPNAGAAARAIADNDYITADKGLFVYFNLNLGFSRVVFSQDLSDNGSFSVLANMTNLTDVANQGQYTAQDFTLV